MFHSIMESCTSLVQSSVPFLTQQPALFVYESKIEYFVSLATAINCPSYEAYYDDLRHCN